MNDYDAEINVVISNEPLYDKINQLKAQIATLNQTIASLNEQIASKDIQISELTSQVSNLTSQVESLTAQVASLTTENAELRAVVEPLREQVATLTEQVSALTAQVSTLTAENTQLTTQVSELQASVQTLTQTVNTLVTKLNTINGEDVQNPADYLLETKAQILTAIQNKGSSATSSTTFRNYANEVSLLNPKGDIHTKLLLRFSDANSYGDVSMYNVPVTFSNSFTRSSSIKKFGDYSAEISNSSYLHINRFEIPVWKYTVEFWIYMTDIFTTNGYCLGYQSNSTISTSSFYIKMLGPYNDTTKLVYRVNNNYDHPIPKSSLTLNEWHHVAYTRNDNYWYTFLDGVRLSVQNSSNLPPAVWTGVDFYLGRDLMQQKTAYIDEFRISDICRYTDTFTPPTEPFSV